MSLGELTADGGIENVYNLLVVVNDVVSSLVNFLHVHTFRYR